MCGNQRVDHDPKAAVELPEDVGVRHGVACARKAAPSVRVGSEGGSGGVAREPAAARQRAAKFYALAAAYTPQYPFGVQKRTEYHKTRVSRVSPCATSAMCATTPSSAVGLGMHSNPRHCTSTCTSPTRPVSLSPLLT